MANRGAGQDVTSQDVWIQGPGGRLFVRIWTQQTTGARVPIVLLHDSLGCVELWRGFPAELCARTGRQVIAYDRLGFGQSDAHPEKPSLDFIAKEAGTGFSAVRRQLGIDRFVLLGHSVGGGMAVNAAARFGGACVALITESAQAFVEDRTLQGIEEAEALFKDPDQIGRLGKYHGGKAAWVVDAWIGSWLDPAFAAWSLQSVLPQVTCPVLAIHGMDDEYGSARHPELIGQFAGGTARVEIMPETRHVPHREKEDAVVDMVAAFLQSLD